MAKLDFNEKTIVDSQHLFYTTINEALQGIILEIEKHAIESEHVQHVMEFDKHRNSNKLTY